MVSRGTTIRADINSFVSAYGEWYDTPQDQWLPWPDWADAPAMQTQGFRPDLWWGAMSRQDLVTQQRRSAYDAI